MNHIEKNSIGNENNYIQMTPQLKNTSVINVLKSSKEQKPTTLDEEIG